MEERNFILLAEDDEDDQELIKMAFTRAASDREIKIVNNGHEALQTLAHLQALPCVIVLDLNMPLLNGIQTLQALNEEGRFKKIPKVILTTTDEESNKTTSYQYGAVDYFVKPHTMKEFVATVQKILSYCT